MGKYDQYLPKTGGGKYDKYLPQDQQDDPALYRLPGVGPYFKRFDQAAENTFGRPPDMSSLSDMGRIAGDSYTLGGADFATNKALGNTQASDATKAARDRQGWAGTAVDLGAGMVSPIALPKKLMQGGRWAKAGWNAGEAGVQGIIDAYTHNPDASWTDLAKAGVTSSGMGATIGAITEPIANFFSRRAARKEALAKLPYKNQADIDAATTAKYKEAEDYNSIYSRRDINKLHNDLLNLNLNPHLDDRATALLKEHLDRYAGKQMSPKDLDEFRQGIRRDVWSNDPIRGGRDQRTHGRMTDLVDAFTTKTQPYVFDKATGRMVKMTGSDVNDKMLEARHLASQGKKYEEFEKAKTEAARSVSKSRGNPFGTSPEQSVITQFSKYSKRIDDEKRSATDLENRLVKRLETGTPLRNMGQKMEPLAFTGRFGAPWTLAGGALGITPGVNVLSTPGLLAGMSIAEIGNQVGQKTTRNQIEDLGAAILDPKGIGTSAAKANEQATFLARLRAARAAAAGGRAIYGNATGAR